jgi:hypothetical protein
MLWARTGLSMFLSVCSPIFESKTEPVAYIVRISICPVKVVKYRHQETFGTKPEPRSAGCWLSADIEYPAWTEDGRLRHPSFKELHGIINIAKTYPAGGHPKTLCIF